MFVIVELCSSIQHGEGLEILKKLRNSFRKKSTFDKDLVKMAEFVLKNNYFDFHSNAKR